MTTEETKKPTIKLVKSESISSLATAMAKFLAEVSDPKRSAKNSHFRSKYATLEEVLASSRALAAEHGLSLIQIPGPTIGNKITLTSMLLHSSGEWIEGYSEMPMEKTTPQGFGSALTYLRRYTNSAMFCLASEDDDGEAAMGRGQGQQQQQSKPRGQAPQRGPVGSKSQSVAAKKAVEAQVTKQLSEQELANLGEMPHGAPRKVGVGNYGELTVDCLPPDYISRDVILATFKKKADTGELPKETFEQLVWQHNAAKMELASR